MSTHKRPCQCEALPGDVASTTASVVCAFRLLPTLPANTWKKLGESPALPSGCHLLQELTMQSVPLEWSFPLFSLFPSLLQVFNSHPFRSCQQAFGFISLLSSREAATPKPGL